VVNSVAIREEEGWSGRSWEEKCGKGRNVSRPAGEERREATEAATQS